MTNKRRKYDLSFKAKVAIINSDQGSLIVSHASSIKKPRPGSLFFGKRGGFCRYKGSDYSDNNK